MKSMKLGIGLLVGGLLAGSSALAQGGGHDHPVHADKKEPASQERKAEIKLQTTCPVMGGAIDKNLYVDHEGKRIYLCCKGCEAPVKKDPVKYIKALEDKGVTVASLQTTCPVMGGKVNKDLYVDHDGKRVYVCCMGCIDAVRKDPQMYIKKLAEKGEVPAAVPQAAQKNQGAHDAQSGHEGHQH
ncbi:MAG: hypothetical protein ABR578_02765 [Chromatocurvus sp.]